MTTVDAPVHRMPRGLIAEDLLWLLLDDQSGQSLVHRISLSRVLAGAILAELTMSTPASSIPPVRISGVGEQVKPGRLVCAHTIAPQADPILARAIELITARPHRPEQVIQKLQRGLSKSLLARLSDDHRVYRGGTRLAGLLPATGRPTQDHRRKNLLRRPLHRVLVDMHEPDPRTGALIALLRSVHALPQQCPGWRRRLIEQCADQFTCGGKTTVGRIVDAVEHAVRAAIADSYANV